MLRFRGSTTIRISISHRSTDRYGFAGSGLSEILDYEFLVNLEYFISIGIYLYANPMHVWMSEHFETGEMFDQSSANSIVQGFVHPVYVGVAYRQYDRTLIFFR